MPTPSGKETTQERETRQRAEVFAAKRAAFTPEILAKAAEDAQYIKEGGKAESLYPAGAELQLRAGKRTVKVDEGEVYQLALADAVEAIGLRVIAHNVRFTLYGGRHTSVYGITLERK